MSGESWPEKSASDGGASTPRSTSPHPAQEDDQLVPPLSPRSPVNSATNAEFPLLSAIDGQRTSTRSLSANFVSSPLNPNATGVSSATSSGSGPASPFARSRPGSRASLLLRVASEESQALASQFVAGQRGSVGSMLLYRLASEDDQGSLLPPKMNRDSIASFSGESMFSISSDSKYPSTFGGRALVAYAYDPDLDEKGPPDEVDALHEPDVDMKSTGFLFGLRGLFNVGVLVILILALLTLFIFYPVWYFSHHHLTIYEGSSSSSSPDDTASDGNVPVLIGTRGIDDADEPNSFLVGIGNGYSLHQAGELEPEDWPNEIKPSLVRIPILVEIDAVENIQRLVDAGGEGHVFYDELHVDGRS